MLKEHLRFVITEDALLLIPMSSQVRRQKKGSGFRNEYVILVTHNGLQKGTTTKFLRFWGFNIL